MEQRDSGQETENTDIWLVTEKVCQPCFGILSINDPFFPPCMSLSKHLLNSSSSGCYFKDRN